MWKLNKEGKWVKVFFTKLIEKASLLDEIAKIDLENTAKSYYISDWKLLQSSKVGAVGFGTGLLGGPWGLALETADMGYLIAMLGRTCYGVGHTLNKKVDYENDIEYILMLWSKVAESKQYKALTGSIVSVSDKIVVDKNNLPDDIQMGDIEGCFPITNSFNGAIVGKTMLKTGTKGTIKVASKVATGIITSKVKNKMLSKTISKASAKFTAKAAGKMSTKWIPIIGGMTSCYKYMALKIFNGFSRGIL